MAVADAPPIFPAAPISVDADALAVAVEVPHAPLTSGSWWLNALNTPTAWGCAAVIAACAVSTAWLAATAWRVGRTSDAGADDTGPRAVALPKLAALRSDHGTATVEFALVFPVLLVMVLTLIQTTLMFTGNLFVHYAAFSAARRAVVEVPRAIADEAINVVNPQDSNKQANVREAAVFAMMPVSGPGTPRNSSLRGGVESIYRRAGQDPPRWSEELLDRRLAYASANTRVAIARIDPDQTGSGVYLVVSPRAEGAAHRFGSRDAVGVIVEHNFFLSVPFVSRLFSDGSTSDPDGHYADLTGYFMLTNEGVVDTLPPRPTIPRGFE